MLVLRHVEGGPEVLDHGVLLVPLCVAPDHVEDGVHDLDVQLLGLEIIGYNKIIKIIFVAVLKASFEKEIHPLFFLAFKYTFGYIFYKPLR